MYSSVISCILIFFRQNQKTKLFCGTWPFRLSHGRAQPATSESFIPSTHNNKRSRISFRRILLLFFSYNFGAFKHFFLFSIYIIFIFNAFAFRHNRRNIYTQCANRITQEVINIAIIKCAKSLLSQMAHELDKPIAHSVQIIKIRKAVYGRQAHRSRFIIA